MKKNSKIITAVVALAALVIVFTGVFIVTRPETDTSPGDKSVCVRVIHKDGTEKVFICHYTDTQYLGELLIAEGIIEGEDGPYGMYIKSVDGEKAVYEEDGAYWAFYEGEDYATLGVDQTPLTDGAVYKLVYTLG